MTKNPVYAIHEGPTGPRMPYSFFKRLDDDGVIFCLKITDAAPDIKVMELAKNSSLPHVIIFRRSVGIHGDFSVYDVPDYDEDPVIAAYEHWILHKNEFPAEMVPYKDVVWIETINEVGRVHSEWLADFAIHTACFAWDDDWRWLAFGWAGGTPEPENWRGANMLSFLRLCAENRDRLGVAVHEYSLSPDIWNGRAEDGSMWLVGRFTHLIEACDDNDIGHPAIFITEWGWGKDKTLIPDTDQRQADYREVADLYAKYDIRCAAVWCLNGGDEWGGLNQIIEQDIPFLEYFNATKEYETEPTEPPLVEPPIEGTTEQKIFSISQSWAFPVNEDAALQAQALADGFTPSGVEEWHTVDGEKYAMQPFYKIGDTNTKRSYYAVIGDWGNVKSTDGTTQPEVFSFVSWPTPHRVVTQEFLANTQLYTQFGLPGHDGVDVRAYHGDAVYAVANGVISDIHFVDDGHNYGIFIRVSHADNYETTYAHLKETIRAVGETVTAGTIIGLADNTGNSNGDHLHLTLKKKGETFTDRCGNTWPSNICDPTPFMFHFSGVTWPGGSPGFPCPDESEPPPAGQTVDMLPYFKPDGQYGLQVVFRFDDGTTQPHQMEARGEQTILWKGEGQRIDANGKPDDKGKLVFDYEQVIANGAGIQKGTDTSSGGASAYNLGWDRWLPRFAEVGIIYLSTPTVKTFNRVTCQMTGESDTIDYIYFKEILDVWVSPYDESIKFFDVPVFEWRKTVDINTPPIEVYKFAKNVMYCEWNNGAVAEVPKGREPLSFELTDCS